MDFSVSDPSVCGVYSLFFDNDWKRPESSMTAENVSSELGYYDDDDIAQLLGISVGRLRNKISAGDPLPIRLRPEGCYKRLWPRQSVHDWLEKYREQDGGHRKPGFLSRP